MHPCSFGIIGRLGCKILKQNVILSTFITYRHVIMLKFHRNLGINNTKSKSKKFSYYSVNASDVVTLNCSFIR